MDKKINKTEEDWKKKLTPEEYRILREKGTEAPFTGKYLYTKDKGVYKCAACGNQLFSSETKFSARGVLQRRIRLGRRSASGGDSGTGWPSFTDPMNLGNIELKEDRSQNVVRTEVLCKKCGSHLGHVFDDGPGESGKRYCINSVCLELEKT